MKITQEERRLKEIKQKFFFAPVECACCKNYVQMGNALYPFLADVFVTECFGKFACIDPRYGVGNFFEALIWPIVVMFNPRRGDESYHNNWVFGVGYIVSILYIVFYITTKKFDKKTFEKYFANKKILEMSCIIIVMSILWAQFMMGYQR